MDPWQDQNRPSAFYFRSNNPAMEILIFKTNLDHPVLRQKIAPFIQSIPGIKKWNIDMDDCDNVLRIEAEKVTPGTIEALLQKAGYFCEELRD